jgi:hypothetical protein
MTRRSGVTGRWSAPAEVVAVAALVLAACSSDDPEAAVPEETTATEPGDVSAG